ncbi:MULTISPECIES: hypothetical protein [Sphingobium]|jgi:hypothetical protein|uniref:Uncharacterized protein n=2 Tax=Sphingobium TaxID=165695 RepID=A0A0J8A8D5_9SPHN|nr:MULTISPECIES: hypothetical protein [Sphingobium]KMS51575.1 hypothetical protein V473_23365 [Sphingobium cupriresistens LL01]NML12505.1 hypothetical protein [Sphingobium psychrophilum]|tara:strand:+ start:31264 stop:31521 length:258 start_codon:yes stop_codon:yes gene_type:complete
MAKSPALESIKQERVKLEAALAAIVQREKEAEDALRDAGRPVLLAALERVKIPELDRSDARAIAAAIAKHGAAKVAAALVGLSGD